MKLSLYILSALICTFLLNPTALAQKIKVGPGGVSVETPNTKVEVDDDRTAVNTRRGGVRVETGGKRDTAQPPAVSKLPRHKAVVCKGTRDLRVKGKAIRGKVGVEVRGACDIFIQDSHIIADRVGAKLSGSGDIKLVDTTIIAPEGLALMGAGTIYLERCTVDASEAGISITGAGDVAMKDSKVKGEIVVTGTGEVTDQGGNTFEK